MSRLAVEGARALSRCTRQTQPLLTQAAARKPHGRVCAYTSASKSCRAWANQSRDPGRAALLSDLKGVFDKDKEKPSEEDKGKGGDGKKEAREYAPWKGRPVVRRDLHKLDEIPAEMIWRCLDSTKEHLYAEYVQSGGKASIMELANRYQLNPHRVKAIIRHMQTRDEEEAREKREADDPSIPKEKKFKRVWDMEDEVDVAAYRYLNMVTGMYGPPPHLMSQDVEDGDEAGLEASPTESFAQAMGIDEYDPFSRPEPLIFNMAHSSNPAFRVISDEEVEKFYSRIAEEALAEDVTHVPTETVSTVPATPLRTDPEIKSRAKLVFTDTSRGAQSEGRDIRVREKDGVLRTASGEEHKQIEKKLYPSKRNTRLF